MPVVTVRAYASIQQLLSPKPFEVKTSASTVKGLIEFLSDKFNTKLKEELLEKNGSLNLKYHIFVNGKNIQHEAGLATPIRDSDLIMISTVIDGG